MRLKKRSRMRILVQLARMLIARLYHGHSMRIGGLARIGRGGSVFIAMGGSIVIGRHVVLSDFVTLEASGGRIQIGDRTTVNAFSRIIAHEAVTIGSGCAIAQFVAVLDHDHGFEEAGPERLSGFRTAPIEIGDNVWIGDKATILRGVRIGNNAVIGAGAVVNKDVPAGAVAVGVPCRILPRLRAVRTGS